MDNKWMDGFEMRMAMMSACGNDRGSHLSGDILVHQCLVIRLNLHGIP